ncbi:hypothetical protein FDECE_584 [Fusarium decemcellulare]|nr:hypothetical protein FDECE_584 [Fusarium decemcellulare]
MRVITATKFTKDGEIHFEEFYGHNIPPYAILSHTWEEGQEVTFEDCKSLVAKGKKGYRKIQKTCQLAVGEGIDYIWIDTCCIDKSSSAELTEAINSMYQWYERAQVCYAYLSDLHGGNMEDCRWFTRGWTLQELIAPNNMKFFDHSWENVGDKLSLLEQLSKITNIEARILSHEVALSYACVAKRFSWAAKRETTRHEDIAYCLLGIFDINMPMIYGEGFKAFVRLQEEIIRTTNDLSIFAWTRHNNSTNDQTPYQNFLAEGPEDFASCSDLRLATDPLLNGFDMSVTNKGIHMQGHHWVSEYKNGTTRYSLGLRCRSADDKPIMVPMRKAGSNAFVRATNASRLDTSSLGIARSYTINSKAFTLLTRLHCKQLTSDKLVSIFRHVAVAVEFAPNISKRSIYAIPQRYWDAEDFLFFSPDTTVQQWGCVRLSRFGEMLVCFWHQRKGEWNFEGTIFNPAGEGMDGLMQDLHVFAESLDYPATVVEGVLKRYGIKPNEQSIEVKHTDGKRFQVSVTFERADDQRVCSGPRFKVQVSKTQII